jgi:hypothetical protein
MNIFITIMVLITILLIIYINKEDCTQNLNINKIYENFVNADNINNKELSNNFMFYQGAKPIGKPIIIKSELQNNINELVKICNDNLNIVAFTNNGELYENINLCYNKGIINLQKGQPYEGTFIKSNIMNDLIINIC